MSWRSNDITLAIQYETTNITYHFEAKKKHNMEQFDCIADNELYMFNKSIRAYVYLLPEVYVHVKPESPITEEENVTILCTSVSNVSPSEYIWIFEDNEIIRQNSTNLIISSADRTDTGNYTCRVKNVVGFGESTTFVRVLYKPYIADSKSNYNYFAENGKPTRIIISIGSYEVPAVAWTTNPGGKVGVWNVLNVSKALYQISSEVIPTSQFHYGVYAIRLRNSIGQFNLEVEITPVVVYIFPQLTTCNISSHITLVCNVKAQIDLELRNEWIHIRNDAVLRSLKGQVKGTYSNLSLQYCDHRDAGKYICNWSTKDNVYFNQSTVLVEDRPVFAVSKIHESPSELLIQVMFYSVPSPSSVSWFYNDRPLQNDSDILQVVSSRKVSIDLYDKHVSVYGFVASLETKCNDYRLFNRLGCQIQNAYGILDISFSDLIFSYPTLENGKYIRTGTLLGSTIGNTTEYANDIQNKDHDAFRSYLYSGGITIFVILIVIVLAVVRRVVTLRPKVAANTTDELTEHELEGIDNEPNIDRLSDQTYEEVENVSYNSVEWRNYNIDMQPAENENIELQEFQQPQYENESYTRNYEDLSSSKIIPNEYVIIERNVEENSKSESEHEETESLTNISLEEKNCQHPLP